MLLRKDFAGYAYTELVPKPRLTSFKLRLHVPCESPVSGVKDVIKAAMQGKG